MLGTLTPGTKGLDCDTPVSAAHAVRLYAAGYRFVIRYVNRYHDPITGELTPLELAALLRAGLAVSVVQHVARPGWSPTTQLGHDYGATAASEASLAGVSQGCTLWCDLEEVAKGTPSADVIGYCNAWFDAVKAAGYDPGLYVGYAARISAHDLYWRLKFRRFWGAFNLDKPDYPAVRGVQMRQFAASSADRVAGVPFEFDVNLAGKDALNDSPVFILPAPLEPAIA